MQRAAGVSHTDVLCINAYVSVQTNVPMKIVFTPYCKTDIIANYIVLAMLLNNLDRHLAFRIKWL